MWQRVIWTSQICGFECRGSTRTKPLVLTKIQVIDIAFSLRTQAVKGPAERERQRLNSTHEPPVGDKVAMRQSLYLLQWLNHSKMV